jgi:hypothetical protein
VEIAFFIVLLNLAHIKFFKAPKASFGFALFAVLFSLASIDCSVAMATYLLVERLTLFVEIISDHFVCFPSYQRKLSDLRRRRESNAFSELLAQKGVVPAFSQPLKGSPGDTYFT